MVKSYRPIPLVLTALIALMSALVALAVSGGHAAHAHGNEHHALADHRHGTITRAELAFRSDMRRLWEDHITWTRLAIISLTTDSPDTDATVARLLRNQSDIGDAIKPFYGDAAGNELTHLLRDHILIAADLVVAAKKGDQAAVADAQKRWEANADDIAAFLAAANPHSWKLGEMKEMLHAHLRLTTEEAVARLEGRWEDDVAAYDAIHRQALGMADMLSTGIIRQFPARFHRG
jgi:hypothetical protein